MYYVYNGFYVFDFIAHYWAAFSALCALLSSHIMTNKDDDDDASCRAVILKATQVKAADRNQQKSTHRHFALGAYVTIATKPVNRLQILPIVHHYREHP